MKPLTPSTASTPSTAFTPVTHIFKNGEELTFSRANQRLKKSIEIMPKNAGVIVHFMFADGSEQAQTITPAHKNFYMFAGHGASAKIGDATSGTASTDDAKAEVARMIKQTETEWNAKRSGGSGLAILIRAIAVLKKISLDEAREKVAGMDEAEVKRIKSLDVIGRAIDVLKLEDQQAKVTANAKEDTPESTVSDIY